MESWLREQQETKSPVSFYFYQILQHWKTNPKTDISYCTFQYIVKYWETGDVHARLPIGLADMGYTREEIDKLKQNGQPLSSIVDEVLARGQNNDD